MVILLYNVKKEQKSKNIYDNSINIIILQLNF